MSRTDHSPFSGLTVKDAVGLYVSSRKNRMRPVSIAASLRGIRDVCPHAPETNSEIIGLVATQASAMGLTVDFDVPEAAQHPDSQDHA